MTGHTDISRHFQPRNSDIKHVILTRHLPTCRCVLQQLLKLRRRELCASDGHEHAELRELRLDVVLLQKTGERGGRDALGGAVGGALHQVNDDLRPERERETATHGCDRDHN